MTTDLIHTDATGLAELIRTGKASSVEVVQAHLDRIEATNPSINAIVTLADGALDAARAADEELAAGGKVGPLHGVPFTVKDSFDTAGGAHPARFTDLRGAHPGYGRHQRGAHEAGRCDPFWPRPIFRSSRTGSSPITS